MYIVAWPTPNSILLIGLSIYTEHMLRWKELQHVRHSHESLHSYTWEAMTWGDERGSVKINELGSADRLGGVTVL